MLDLVPVIVEEGFGSALRLSVPLDEDDGPRLVFADGDAVHLPRRHVGRRPNGHRPHTQRRGLLLAEPGLWPLRRQGRDGQGALVRGTRTSSTNGASVWLTSTAPAPPTSSIWRATACALFNQSGNRWSDAAYRLAAFPPVDNLASRPGARPARQRHGLPGLVVPAAGATRAGRCATST